MSPFTHGKIFVRMTLVSNITKIGAFDLCGKIREWLRLIFKKNTKRDYFPLKSQLYSSEITVKDVSKQSTENEFVL